MIEWGITSTLFVLAVLLIRLVCKNRISKKAMYLLWLPVLIRLLLPVTLFHNSLGIANYLPDNKQVFADTAADKAWDTNIVPYEQITAENLAVVHAGVQTEYEGMAQNINEIIPMQHESSYPGENLQIKPVAKPVVPTVRTVKTFDTVFVVWCAGAVISGLVFLIMNLVFGFRLKKTRKDYDSFNNVRVFDSRMIISPCLFGGIRPAIYLNSEIIADEDEYKCVLIHEYMHFLHRDNLWSILRIVALSLHWYNPVVWYGMMISIQDCEMACDEAVIRTIGEDNRIAYGNILLHMISVGRGFENITSAATTMVDNKKNIKERIISITSGVKASKAVMMLAVIIVIAAAIIAFSGKDAVDKEQKEADNQSFEESEADEDEDEDTMPFTDAWAKALCDDNYEALGEYSSDTVKDRFEKEGYPLTGYEKCGYFIQKNVAGHATILYYIVTPEIKIDVWAEDIYTRYGDEGLVVTDEMIEHIGTVVDSYDTLEALYPFKDNFNDSALDFLSNGLGEKLNEAATNDREKYSDLFEPDTAAGYILNLSDDKYKIDYSHINVDKTMSIVRMDFNLNFPTYLEVKMVKPYGEDGIWILQDLTDLQNRFKDKEITSYQADLTGDGVDDTISVTLNCYDTDDEKDAENLVQNKGRFVTVGVEDVPQIGHLYINSFSIDHTSNGQLSLVKRDGKYYLLETDIWTGQGVTEYSFEVKSFNADYEPVVVDSYSGGGQTGVSQDCEEFINRLAPWIEDGIILCAVKADWPFVQEVCISTPKKTYSTKDYYNNILSSAATNTKELLTKEEANAIKEAVDQKKKQYEKEQEAIKKEIDEQKNR